MLLQNIWYSAGRPSRLKSEIRRLVAVQPELRVEFACFVSSNSFPRIRRSIWKIPFWLKRVRFRLGHRAKRGCDWLNREITLLRNLKRISSGEALDLVGAVLSRASSQDGRRQIDFSVLARLYGGPLAKAVESGSRLTWRRFRPELPHERSNSVQVDQRVEIGLAGLQVEFGESELKFKQLSSSDAGLAARYATNQLNGFPSWLPGLVVAHPTATSEVLKECLRGECVTHFQSNRHPKVLHDLVYYGEGVRELVTEPVFDLLENYRDLEARMVHFLLLILLRSRPIPKDRGC
jgi:hypothetical protein